MLARNNFYTPQNWLVFRTPSGSRRIEAGQTVRLTDSVLHGVSVAGFYTVRIYAACRINGTVPVSFYIDVLDRPNEELIFSLDSFTLQPGTGLTRTYNVPGRALVVFAVAEEGTGGTGVDFGIIGFGSHPRLQDVDRQLPAVERATPVPTFLKGVVK